MRVWCCVVACLLLFSACGDKAVAGGSAEQVGAIYNGCVEAMLRSTCQAMNDKSELPASEVVLIAGVGRVDAKAYRALREAGEGMCAQVQSSCGALWEGAPCRTARALWGGDTHKPR
jgi:hypothetical protein